MHVFPLRFKEYYFRHVIKINISKEKYPNKEEGLTSLIFEERTASSLTRMLSRWDDRMFLGQSSLKLTRAAAACACTRGFAVSSKTTRRPGITWSDDTVNYQMSVFSFLAHSVTDRAHALKPKLKFINLLLNGTSFEILEQNQSTAAQQHCKPHISHVGEGPSGRAIQCLLCLAVMFPFVYNSLHQQLRLPSVQHDDISSHLIQT